MSKHHSVSQTVIMLCQLKGTKFLNETFSNKYTILHLSPDVL